MEIASNHTDASSVESHSSLGLTHMWVLMNTTWFQGWGNWVWLFLHETWPMKYSTRSLLSIIFTSQNTQLLLVPHDTTSDRYLTGPKATPPSYSTFYVLYTSLKCREHLVSHKLIFGETFQTLRTSLKTSWIKHSVKYAVILMVLLTAAQESD